MAQLPLFTELTSDWLVEYEQMADNLLKIERQQIVFGDFLSDDERQIRCNAILGILKRRYLERMAQKTEPPPPDPDPEPVRLKYTWGSQLEWRREDFRGDESYSARDDGLLFWVYQEDPRPWLPDFEKGTRWALSVLEGATNHYSIYERPTADAAKDAAQEWWNNPPLWIKEPEYYASGEDLDWK